MQQKPKIIWLPAELFPACVGIAIKRTNTIYLSMDLKQTNPRFIDDVLQHELKHLKNTNLWQDIRLDFKDFFRDYFSRANVYAYAQLQKAAMINNKEYLLRNFVYILFQSFLTFLKLLLFPLRVIFLFFPPLNNSKHQELAVTPASSDVLEGTK